jgi:hypothetical protein
MTDLVDSQFFLYRQEHLADLTKAELFGLLLKVMQTDRDLNFLLSLEEKDLTTLLVALRERIENRP